MTTSNPNQQDIDLAQFSTRVFDVDISGLIHIPNLCCKKVKEDQDCTVDKREFACKPDCEIYKTFRDGIDSLVVKSVKTGEKVGGANLSACFFKGEDLFYDNVPFDAFVPGPVAKDGRYHYLKVLPCDTKKQCYGLALCDKDGNVVTKAKNGVIIHLSKCNIIGGQDIELENHIRKDWLPSFIIQRSSDKCKDGYYKAEVYTYDPTSDEIGDKVGKLNTTSIKLHGSNLSIRDYFKYHGPEHYLYSKAVTIKEENGLYKLYKQNSHKSEEVDAYKKLLLDDVLCLCDRSVLQDGYGVEIIG